MYKKYILGSLLVLGMLLSTGNALAFGGVQGTLIDSIELDPWTFGAEVFVINLSTGQLVANDFIVPGMASNGVFSLTYGEDSLGECANYGGCVAPNNFQTIRVIINFTCDLSETNGSRPTFDSSDDVNCPINNGARNMVALPAPIELDYTELNGGIKQLSFVQTSTDPLAVVLRDASANDLSSQPADSGLVMVLLMAVLT
ncbi:MAG TPA: hypothetical protein VLL52_14895, partial [Anaerolineae bacterium]|nr:hypothetical protein [Anaerolineae bacterium]